MSAALDLIFPFSATSALVKIIAEKLAATNIDAPPNADLVSVRTETERQENEMRRLEAQAKVAQEMAIANRIEGALEVQIEEFYEYAGEGKAGLNTDGSGLTLGVSGGSKRVSKRVYRFTGKILPDGNSDKTE